MRSLKGGMMKNMKKAIFLMLILGLTIGLGHSLNVYAQEAQPAPVPEAAPAMEGQEAYGEVVSVDANAGTVAITEYDYEKDQDINKTYTVDKAATYENVKSLNEIKVGDWVALTLKPEKEGVNIATSVYVERYDIGEEAVPVVPTAPAPAVVPEHPAPEAAPAEHPAPAAEHPAPVETK